MQVHVHAQIGAIDFPLCCEDVWRTRALNLLAEVVSGDEGYLELGGEDSAFVLTPQLRSLVALHKLCTHTKSSGDENIVTTRVIRICLLYTSPSPRD